MMPLFFLAILFILSLSQAKGQGFGATVGAATTLSPFPLWGIHFGLIYRQTPKDEKFYDFQLDQYYLSGNSSGLGEDEVNHGSFGLQDGENVSTATVTLNAQLISMYMLYGSPEYFWGPGIGYGFANVTEKQSSSARKDPTPFFSKNDIHFGTLMLKLGKSFDDFDCEIRFNSFGGLISGEGACGIFF